MQTVKEGETIHSLRFVREHMTVAYRETPYKIRKEIKRFGWLANLAWKLLHKLNALDIYSEKVTTWRYDEAKAKTLASKILEMREELARYYEEPGDWIVVMGGRDFMELMHSPHMNEVISFQVPINHRSPTREVAGMTVHVVPYHAGMAVLPKSIIEDVRMRSHGGW